jgi:NADH dehydrogenase FAD-containing subunit
MTGHSPESGKSGTIRVVVIGAGYAGMIATNRFLGSLSEEESRRITLTVINERSVFVERIRLHELAAGSRGSVTLPLSSVLHPGASIVVGRARLIDPVTRMVQVESDTGKSGVPYDYLIYAVGSVAAAPVPGAVEHAFLIGDYDGAAGAAAAISAAGPGPRIAVVGGGFTGVETASELAEQHPGAEVTLYCAGPLLPGARPAARASIGKTLKRLGVSIEADSAVAEIEAGKLRLRSGRVHAFDACLLAASFGVPDLAARSGLAVTGDGRLRVDEHLRCVGEPAVIGAGDAVAAPAAVAAHLRMGCAVALPLGGHAAETLLASIRGRALPVLSAGFVIQCISLGRKKGYIQVVRPDDTPRALHVTGRMAARVKEMICTMVVERPKQEIAKPGAYSWPKGPRLSRPAR